VRKSLIALTTAFLLITIIKIDLSAGLTHPIGSTDLVFFWVAGELFVNNNSPYNIPLYLEGLQKAGLAVDNSAPPLVWNPPWVFSLLVFFPHVSLKVFAKFWLLASIASFVFVFFRCKKICRLLKNKGSESANFITSIVVLTYFPLFLCLWLGQIIPVVLIALVLCVYYELHPISTKRHSFLSGFFLSFASIKPHLLYLFAAEIIAWRFKKKDKWWLTGLITGISLFNVIPLFMRPTIYQEFFSVLQNPPLYWKNSTILALLFPGQSFAILKFAVPIMCMISVVVWRLTNASIDRKYLLLLIPLSFVTSPYGWVYDFILFLPCLIWYGKSNSYLAVIFCFLNFIMFFMPSYEMEWFVWFPLVFLLMVSFQHYCSARTQIARI
jgi:hypothetical protein